MPLSSRHHVQHAWRMEDQLRQGVVDPPPPTLELQVGNSRNVQAAPSTGVQDAEPHPRPPTPSGAVDAQTTPAGAPDAQPTPDEPMSQATTSSSAIESSGGWQIKRPADPTVEGKIPTISEVKPRGRPITRILPIPGTEEYTGGCPGCIDKATITMHTVNVELPSEKCAHLTWEVPFKMHVTLPKAGSASASYVGDASQAGSSSVRVETHAGVQAQAGPRAVHVGAANETPRHAVQVGIANARIATAQLQPADQDMADAEADHDVTTVRNWWNGEPSHQTKGYFDEDYGTALDRYQVRGDVEREMVFMVELGVGEPRDRPKTGKVWSTRWCYRRKGDTVRSRLVVKHFREGTDPSVHAGTPGPAAARILLTLSAISSLFAATADLSVAFMHTPMTERCSWNLQSTQTCQVERFGGCEEYSTACDALRHRPQAYRPGMAAPSIYHREGDAVKMSVHVDDPLVIGPEGPIRVLFLWLGQRTAVKGLET